MCFFVIQIAALSVALELLLRRHIVCVRDMPLKNAKGQMHTRGALLSRGLSRTQLNWRRRAPSPPESESGVCGEDDMVIDYTYLPQNIKTRNLKKFCSSFCIY